MQKLLSLLSFIGFFFVIRYFYLNNPADNKTPFVFCMSKRLSGFDCPGCGGQRAFHQLLHGNFIEAAKLNIFIYLFAPLLVYIFLSFALKPFKIEFPDIDLSVKGVLIILGLLIIFSVLRNISF